MSNENQYSPNRTSNSEVNSQVQTQSNPLYDAYIDDLVEMTTGMDSDEFDEMFPDLESR